MSKCSELIEFFKDTLHTFKQQETLLELFGWNSLLFIWSIKDLAIRHIEFRNYRRVVNFAIIRNYSCAAIILEFFIDVVVFYEGWVFYHGWVLYRLLSRGRLGIILRSTVAYTAALNNISYHPPGHVGFETLVVVTIVVHDVHFLMNPLILKKNLNRSRLGRILHHLIINCGQIRSFFAIT